MNGGDRINEIYYGKLLSKESQEQAQSRIDWICRHVTGSTVLDIGCSQGIVSILLARKGKTVTGVDVSEEAINYARQEIALETIGTQERITLLHSDALQYDFGANSYDVVIMGQLIEHVENRRAFLDLARRVCCSSGRVIITTPFGLLDSPDHKWTFYPHSFMLLVAPFFEPNEFEVIGKRICFTGTPRRAVKDIEDAEIFHMLKPELLERIYGLSEREFERVERYNHNKWIARSKRIEKLESGKERVGSRLKELKENAEKAESRIKELEGNMEIAETRIKEIAGDREQAGVLIKDLTEDKKKAETRIKELESEIEQAGGRIEELTADNEKARSRIKEIEKQRDSLRGKILKAEDRYEQIRLSSKYCIGDAIGRAVRPSRDTIALPILLYRIYRRYRLKKESYREQICEKNGKKTHGITAIPTNHKADKAKSDIDSYTNIPHNGKAVYSTPEHVSIAPAIKTNKRVKNARILFMPTNGAGLGHVTRLLAIARRLIKDTRISECVFLTTSDALNIFRKEGFTAYHYPSPDLLRDRIKSKGWNNGIKNILTMIMHDHEINAFIFDGVFPYAGMLDTITRNEDLFAIWVKRGMLKPGVDDRVNKAKKSFDVLIVPGEVGQKNLSRDSSGMIIVPPIVYLDKQELLPREIALDNLGLDPKKKTVFIQPAAGNVKSVITEVETIIDTLKKYDGLQIVLTESIISKTGFSNFKDVRIIRGYPLSIYYLAFDFAICAAGYNTFAEMLYFGIPSIFVPRTEAQSDDQLSRAMICEVTGTGLVLHPFSQQRAEKHIETMLDEEKNAEYRKRCSNQSCINGADVAVSVIKDLILTEE